MIDREESVITAAGDRKWFASTKVPLRNDKGEIFGLMGISRDITELKATRAVANERLSLQALIDWLPDNLWVKDVKSRFVICNKVTATRMGYRRARRPDRQDRPRAPSQRRSRRSSSPTSRRSSAPGSR